MGADDLAEDGRKGENIDWRVQNLGKMTWWGSLYDFCTLL
jgi:hypothetical protein